MGRIKPITHYQTARNPVARAVAAAGMRKMLNTLRLRLYIMQDGEDARQPLDDALYVISVSLKAAVYQWGQQPQDRDKLVAVRLMKGAVSTITQLLENGAKWRSEAAVAIERGIDEAEVISRVVKAEYMYDAIMNAGVPPRST